VYVFSLWFVAHVDNVDITTPWLLDAILGGGGHVVARVILT